jgi:heme/copper-type cytochrome/quinol oxidase subunit 2
MPLPLADAIFWVAVACCVVAQWFIVRGALGASAPPAAGSTGPVARRALETAWAIVPAIALALVLAATWRAMRPAATADRAPSAERAPAPAETGA